MKDKIINFFKSNKLIKITSVIALILLLCTIVGPSIILEVVRQPKTENHKYSEYFYSTYDDVRNHLKERVDLLKENEIYKEIYESQTKGGKME